MSRKDKKNQRGRVGKILVQESLDWSDIERYRTVDPVRRGWNVFRKGKKNHGVRVGKV